MLALKKAILSVLFFVFIYCVLITTGIVASAAAEETGTSSYVDNTVIVVIDQQYSNPEKVWQAEDFYPLSIIDIEELSRHSNASLGNYNQILKLELQNSIEMPMETAINELNKFDYVYSADLDYIIKKAETDVTTQNTIDANATSSISRSVTVPNDSLYSDQWYMSKIQADLAWDEYTTGLSEVRVGLIDDGIAEHEDLIGNVVQGYDFENDNTITSDVPDCYSTRVASVIAAQGNNGIGLTGMAWDVSLVPLQISTHDSVPISNMIEAFLYAEANNIDILHCSYFVYPNEDNQVTALRVAMQNFSGLIICHAGNSKTNFDTTTRYPVTFQLDNMIVVAGSDQNDALYNWDFIPTEYMKEPFLGWSGYGANSVDLAAPATSIVVAQPVDFYGNYYIPGDWDTNLGAALVTGTAALLKSYNTDLNAVEIKKAILDNVDVCDELVGKVRTGGRLNVYKALQSVLPTGKTRTVNANVILTSSTANNCTFTINYDYTKFRFKEVRTTGFSSETTCTVSNTQKGCLTINITSATPLESINELDILFTTYSLQSVDTNDITATNISSGITFTYNVVLMGDVNFDNIIATEDARIVMEIATDLIELSDIALIAADMDYNGTITTADSRVILRIV